MPAMETKRTGDQCVSVSLSELLMLSNCAKELSLSALRVKGVQSGQHLSHLLGRGMEFAECRRYHGGDDIRTIDWRVTARTGKVHTKLFSAEKERQVLVCGDMRSAMFFATRGVFKSVQASLLMGYIAWSASQAGNRFGGILFDDTSLYEFRPALGKRGVLPFLHRLSECATFHPRSEKSSTTPTMEQAFESIKRVASPGSLLFVMSDFRHFSPYARDLLVQIAKHSDLCLCFLYDTLEEALPRNGVYPVSDGKNELNLNTFDKKRLENYQKQFANRREQVSSMEREKRVQFIPCSTEEDCFSLLKKHFR